MNPIVIKIKEEMVRQGLSEQRLADKAGLTQNKVHRIVSGKAKRLDIEAINSLVSALGIDSSDASVTPITGTSSEWVTFGPRPGPASPDPIRQAIERELDRMTRKQLAELLNQLVSENEENGEQQ